MDRADPMALPRSVQLALWVQHAGAGAEPLQRALRAVQGDDEPHTVATDDDAPSDWTGPLPSLLAAWAAEPRSAAAVLPVPGDVEGVPAAVSGHAVDAGECVLIETVDGPFAAVPEIEEFGSIYETGHLVTWHVQPVPPWSTVVLGAVGSVTDAERALRTALIQSTDALDSLDVASWRADASDAIARLRSGADPHWALPPSMDPRRVRVLLLAARLRAIVALATADDGGAVNLWQADQRSTALREIDRAARRAMAAATLLR